MRKHMLE